MPQVGELVGHLEGVVGVEGDAQPRRDDVEHLPPIHLCASALESEERSLLVEVRVLIAKILDDQQ